MVDPVPRSITTGERMAAAPSPTVGEIMSGHVVMITMDDTLGKARELFAQFRFHHLLVVQQKRLVGIISDRDLLKAISPYVGTISETDRDHATLNKRVHFLMSRNPVTVRPDTTLAAAAQTLVEKGVSCLPVVGEDGTLEGIITWRDLLKALLSVPTPSS
jgi:acetoin utilization protein AcuB